MATRKITNVLIPDGERILAKFVVNCLSGMKDVKIHVLSMDHKASIKYSRYIDHYSLIDHKTYDSKWIAIIKEYIQDHDIDVLMPVEIENIQLIGLSDQLDANLVKYLVPPSQSFETTLDKWEFFKFLKKNGIPTPESYEDAEAVENSVDESSYPLLMKPKTGMGGFGITKQHNLKEVQKAFSENKYYMAQELINGYDIDMSVLCEGGKILAYTIQKGYVFSSAIYSAALGVKFRYEEAIFKQVKQLMESLEWSGFAHADLRFDEADGMFKILEVNPRAWGSIEASKSVGINFPYLYILSCLGEQYEMPKYKFESCCTNVGLLKITKSKLKKKKDRIPFPDHWHQIRYFLDPLPLLKNYYNSKKKH